MQSPGLGFGQRISALEAEVAQLKRQVERLLSNPVVPATPTVVPTTVIAARGLEFINVGDTTIETFEKHVASLKRVLQSISNVNCAVYVVFSSGARYNVKAFPQPRKTPAVGIVLSFDHHDTRVIEGVTFFALKLDDSALSVRGNSRENDEAIARIVAHVKGSIGENLNFWD